MHLSKYQKIFVILAIPILLGSLFTFIFRVQLSVVFNQVYSHVAYKYPTQFNLKVWSFSVRNDFYRDYLESKQIPLDLIQFSEINNPTNTFTQSLKILEYAGQNNINVKLIAVREYNSTEIEPTSFQNETSTDPQFLENKTYTVKGKAGEQIYSIKTVKLTSLINTKEKQVSKTLSDTKSSVNQITYTGSKSNEESTTEVNKMVQNLVKNIKAKDFDSLNLQLITQDYPIYDQDNASDLELRDIKYAPTKDFEVDYAQKFVPIGKVNIKSEKCNYYIQLDLTYDYLNKEYKIYSVKSLTENLCDGKNIYPVEGMLATCKDCKFFPVDKTKALAPDYVPENLVSLQDLGSDAQVSSQIYEDLKNFYNDSKKAGHNTYITSAYRSFEQQTDVFDYWVKRDIALFGNSLEQAIPRANRYSAIPGFSEHQLGTTVDLNAFDCNAFEGYCQQNEDLWAWLYLNAHKYGFVLSYPKNSESITGYISEPWHYRWIGKNLSKEYKSQEGELTLNMWLQQKNGIL